VSARIADFAEDNRSLGDKKTTGPMSRLGGNVGDCKTAPWQRQEPPCPPESRWQGVFSLPSESEHGQQDFEGCPCCPPTVDAFAKQMNGHNNIVATKTQVVAMR
jgi:hypothetical protein